MPRLIDELQYNNGKMDKQMFELRNPRLLDLTVYMIVMIMVIISFISLADVTTKIAAIALCIAFSLLHAFGFRNANTSSWLAIYFAVQTVIILVLLRLSPPRDVFNFLFYILAFEAVMTLPIRTAIGWIVGFFLLDSLNALWNQGIGGVTAVLFYAAAFALTMVTGYALRQAEFADRRNKNLLEELRKTQHQLQNMAVNEERTRMAREMHDSLGHRLTVTIVQLEGAQRLIPTDPERATRIIATMRDEIKDALSELRRTVASLRSPVINNLALDKSLATLSKTFQGNTGIPTHFSVTPGFPNLPDSYRLAFYRAAQEALTNIQRHALAHNGWLYLRADDHQIVLVVEDDGKGMKDHGKNSAGSGLVGLKERAEHLGGEVRLAERPGGGTQLIFCAPLPKQEMNL